MLCSTDRPSAAGKPCVLIKHQKSCEQYRKFRSERSKVGSIAAEMKLRDRPDREEFLLKMGESVRKSIISNPQERERRRKVANGGLVNYNKSERGRRRSSEVAKITSSRPEIQAARAKRLHDLGTSKPERELFDWVKIIDKTFQHSVQIKSDTFSCSSKRRQIDMLSRDRKIGIEFDGPLHFRSLSWKSNIEERISRDREVEAFMMENDFCYIRISFDQYRSDRFQQESMNEIRKLVDDPVVGIHKIGKMYAENCSG
jgi:ribulose bisphosphate carboxylase small subunit